MFTRINKVVAVATLGVVLSAANFASVSPAQAGWVSKTWESLKKHPSKAIFPVAVAVIAGSCIVSAGAGCTVLVTAPAAAP